MRIRITFVKQGALRYTGHLDLHKLWERALRRAELPLAYSQGFHPQPKMNMAAALPLGFSSRCEVMDMKLEQDIPLETLPTRLNSTLPSGLQVIDVQQVDDRAPALQTQVLSAEYEVTVTEAVDGSELKRKIDSVIVGQPSFLAALDKLIEATPLPVWKAYFEFHLVSSFAPYLSQDFVDENFAFRGAILADTKENRSLQKRAIAEVNRELGEMVGKAYVQDINISKRHFKPGCARQAGIVDVEQPIHLSNLALVDPKVSKPTRVRSRTLANGRKVRIAIASGEQMARE